MHSTKTACLIGVMVITAIGQINLNQTSMKVSLEKEATAFADGTHPPPPPPPLSATVITPRKDGTHPPPPPPSLSATVTTQRKDGTHPPPPPPPLAA